MIDTDTQPKVDFIHNQIPNKLESIRSLLEGEYASAAQSPDHETGPWSPEQQAHVEAVGAAIARLDAVSDRLQHRSPVPPGTSNHFTTCLLRSTPCPTSKITQ